MMDPRKQRLDTLAEQIGQFDLKIAELQMQMRDLETERSKYIRERQGILEQFSQEIV